MKNHLYMSDEDQNGGPRSSFWWWKSLEEFDENGKFKAEIAHELGNMNPRIKVVREMERLGFMANYQELNEMKEKHLSYKAGDFWLPIGGITKEETDIPPVITILLIGFIGSGKSSLINFMYSLLGRSGLIPFAQTSGESSNYTTMYLEEHNVLRSPTNGFCVYDTRGLDHNQVEEGLNDVVTWMSDGIRHNQPCHRSEDEEDQIKVKNINDSNYIKRKVNGVMVVADLSQIHNAFKSGDFKTIEALKALFHLSAIKNSNENPILILTHGDTLNAEDRINGRLKICEYLGIPETNGAYDVTCLTEQGILAEEFDPVTAFTLTEAVYRALLQSDRSHLPKKSFKDWFNLFFSSTMCFIASFLAHLANFFSKFEHQKKKLKI